MMIWIYVDDYIMTIDDIGQCYEMSYFLIIIIVMRYYTMDWVMIKMCKWKV